VCKEHEVLTNINEHAWVETVPGKLKWITGNTYAVVPKRGQPAVWWKRYGDRPQDYFLNRGIERHYASEEDIADGAPVMCLVDMRDLLPGLGFQPARIRITSIRCEQLQDISEADARAEGVADVAAYRQLWDSINGRTKGARWADNPQVWVLEFELLNDGGAS